MQLLSLADGYLLRLFLLSDIRKNTMKKDKRNGPKYK
jgi:hypothetical protein